MTTSRVTYYDVLGVAPDADADTIRAAWRAVVDRFDPVEGGPQFKLYTAAAEVLLHPERRAAYDAELAGQAPSVAAEPAAVPVEVVPAEGEREEDRSEEDQPDEEEPEGALPPAPAVDREVVAGSAADGDGARSPGPSRLLVACVAVVALVALVGAGWTVREAQRADAADEARRVAPAVAAEAAQAVLSYDYETLAEDRDAGVRYFTGAYREEYIETMDTVIAEAAPQTQAVVTAEVLDTAVVSAEPGRAEVLLYVNQTTTSTAQGGEPQVALNRVRFTMVEEDGTWLVEDIESY